MMDLPYSELLAQQAEICRRQRAERWDQAHPNKNALPQLPNPRPENGRDIQDAGEGLANKEVRGL